MLAEERGVWRCHGSGLRRSIPHSLALFFSAWTVSWRGELDELLPAVGRIEQYSRQRFGSDVCLCHCFLRRYLVEERRILAAHFDHHAFVTAVVGLNPDEFEGGLFVQGEATADRAFIGLGKGDVLFHQYNLHHGVEVWGGSRYSLVCWLMDCRESCVLGTVPWYHRSAEAGDADAQHLWATCLVSGQHSGRRRDVLAAIPWFEKSVAQRNVEGMNTYAALLWEEPLVQDESRAVALWEEASARGYAKARGNLGGILCSGVRVPQDITKGLQLLRSASELGDYDAMFKFAMHLRQTGKREAYTWMKRCAEVGNPEACMMMAEFHISGEVESRDGEAVTKYTRWAANLGHCRAMTALGRFYAFGEYEVAKDMCRAVALWEKAASHGEADAQMSLATCYLRGEGGLKRDEQKAAQLCDAAASRGHLTALQHQLDFRVAAHLQLQGTGGGGPLQHEDRDHETIWECVD